MWKFNKMSHSYDSAFLAYKASSIESTLAKEAPTGAFHFWQLDTVWHVGQGLTPGGRFIFMATGRLTAKVDTWAPALGIMSVKAYPGEYRGWALKDGDQPSRPADDLGRTRTQRRHSTEEGAMAVHDSGARKVRRIARYLNARHLGLTTAASETGHRMDKGTSSSNYWRLIQRAGHKDGLYGPESVINGIPGPRSYAAEDHYAAVAPA
jgi:hypothetical protein